MADRFTLLPSVRTAVGGRATAPEAGRTRRQVRIGVQVVAGGAAHGTPHPVGAEVLGAADIVALDTAMIAGTEPGHSARAVEPNYFPYVDFVDCDFLWRYSLDVGGPNRVRPWLLLVVLEASEFRHLGRGAGPLPRIEVFTPATSLPNPDQSWAFAHVQVARTALDGDLQQVLGSAPETCHARLLCPRRLRDNTPYTMFLVPTYEAGRLTGIGVAASVQPWDAYAWDPSSTNPVELPYYAHWTFRTSTLEDFESLVRRLRPVASNDGSPHGGTRTVFAGRPGYYDDVDEPTLTFEAEGALQQVGFTRQEPLIAQTPLTPRLERTLTAAIESDLPADQVDGPEHEDPLVALPVYGRHFAQPDAIDAEAATTPWVHQVNLDTRMRLAAGVGARIVRRHQERFAQQCWEQVGAVREANDIRARLQLLGRLTEVLVDKHLAPLSAGAAGQIATSLLHVVKTPFGGNRTAKADLRVRGVPDGYDSPLVRRLVAKRPDVTVTPRTSSADRARRAIDHGGLLGGLESLTPPTEAELRGAVRRTEARRAVATDVSDLAHVIPFDLAAVHPASFAHPSFEVGQVDDAQIVQSVVARIRDVPMRKAGDLIDGPHVAERMTLEPLVRRPRLPVPLSAHIAEEDVNHLLPNVGALPDNSVTLVVENQTFIEALLAGANHEMNRELRWREFPVSMTGAPFTRFWRTGRPPEDASGDDVRQLRTWTGALGTHQRRAGDPRLTLVVTGDLVRRYADLMVAANHQVIPQGGVWKASRGTTTHPVFAGVIGDATAFYGFDLSVDEVRATADHRYFILYEPTNRFRFGLDIATRNTRRTRRRLDVAPMPFPLVTMDPHQRAVRLRSLAGFWNVPPTPAGPTPQNPDDLSWDHVTLDGARYVDVSRQIVFDDGSDLWGPDRTSASIARATMQKPVSAVVPARGMLSDV